jgi:Uma2 family endonuclease
MDAVTTKPARKTNPKASETSLRDLVEKMPNGKLILQNISWKFYEELLKEYENSNTLHFAYDKGYLEIEMPNRDHEKHTRLLGRLVEVICEELEINFDDSGQTTLRKKVKAKGAEPDTAYYIQNEPQMRGKLNFDLANDPPPDLVIEVDVTSPSLDKLPIYAALGVPEVWLYKGEKVVFYSLQKGKYKEIQNSAALPILTSEKAMEFLESGLQETSSAWLRAVREWAVSRE